MDIVRIFDALNDVRNLTTAIKAVKQHGKHARGELCYTISPAHTVENFVRMGVELEKMGCDSIGIKDMSGIIQPQIAFRMVQELKSKIGIPITLHTHDTAGLGAASYLAAIDAGVEVVDRPGARDPGTLRADIEFDQVAFAYKEGKPVLHDFNLKVKRGATIALVGPTGGGKTTIVNLLCRFYEPMKGMIRINDHDYMDYTDLDSKKSVKICEIRG